MKNSNTLCIDLGGTHCRFQLVVEDQSNLHTKPYVKFKNDDFDSFYSSLEEFLANNDNRNDHQDTNIVIGMAGIVEDNLRGSITNRNWSVSAKELKKRFGFANVLVLNDLEAAAWGVLNHAPDITLYDGDINYEMTGLTIGVGTGLGLAYFHNKKNLPPIVYSTETGQSAFSPLNDFQKAIHNKLLKTHGHASIEYILSGSGLKFIYDHIAIDNQKTSAQIIQSAKDNTDSNADTALLIFAQTLGQVLGNLTLVFRPHAGIHLIGGMIERTLPWLNTQVFLDSYLNQARMSHIPKSIPIFIHTNDELALKGCLFASQNFSLRNND